MNIEELARQPVPWLSPDPVPGVIVSSRVRLARNIAKAPFPGWAGKHERMRLYDELCGSLNGLATARGLEFLGMGELDPVNKQVLHERQLISHELLRAGKGSGVAMTPAASFAVLVNEEDHLRLQALGTGMDVGNLWETVDAVDTEIGERVEYAFSSRFGYLTACPTNAGTGLRASAMLHLPGLKLTNDLDGVIKGLGRLGFAVRGFMGEGSEAHGDMFQISNQTTLGLAEKEIIRRLARIVMEVAEHEQDARARLAEDAKFLLLDYVGRAFGILTNARVLGSEETLDLLSAMRLGIAMGIMRGLEMNTINDLMMLTQPAHLQRIQGTILQPVQRDELRATIARERFNNVSVVNKWT